MDRYLVPLRPATKPKPISTPRWKRSLIELNGKFEPRYRHDILGLLMQSYSQIGLFAHLYHIGGVQCPTHISWFHNRADVDNPMPFRKRGISALEFDSKGIYLASVTREGCLTVHDFETLYSQVNFEHPGSKEDETKQLLHLSMKQLDVVRWNLANQDEVACTSMNSSGVHIFDIGSLSPNPVEVLRKKPIITIHGFDTHTGFSDIAFSSNNHS
ncbi:hypothetical protein NMG60_11033775, partial [Bertholletia excelsa]